MPRKPAPGCPSGRRRASPDREACVRNSMSRAHDKKRTSPRRRASHRVPRDSREWPPRRIPVARGAAPKNDRSPDRRPYRWRVIPGRSCFPATAPTSGSRASLRQAAREFHRSLSKLFSMKRARAERSTAQSGAVAAAMHPYFCRCALRNKRSLASAAGLVIRSRRFARNTVVRAVAMCRTYAGIYFSSVLNSRWDNVPDRFRHLCSAREAGFDESQFRFQSLRLLCPPSIESNGRSNTSTSA